MQSICCSLETYAEQAIWEYKADEVTTTCWPTSCQDSARPRLCKPGFGDGLLDQTLEENPVRVLSKLLNNN